MKPLLLVLMLEVLVACAQTPAHDRCAGFKPIHPTKSDVGVISDTLTGQIVAHNSFGMSQCGWKP
jgi:hypothetical protein